MKQPIKVLICGSNYARSYIRALALVADRYSLAGLLARGSDRSERVARRYGLPMHHDPGTLPCDIDIACAAMSSDASDVVLRLIERGIHVICEHPQKPAFLERALEAAGRSGSRFHLNGHFGDLPAPSAFIQRCKGMMKTHRPAFVRLTATDRSLWGALDVLQRAIGTLDPFEVRSTGTTLP